MSRDPELLLDMLTYAREALSFCEGISWEQFAANRMLQMATQHALQVIGEAAFKVSREFRDAHPEIPWVRIVGLRHRLVHDYPRIELPKVWVVVMNHLPDLVHALKPLVPPDE